MLKTSVTMNFFLQKDLMFTGVACIPRNQAQKIPALCLLTNNIGGKPGRTPSQGPAKSNKKSESPQQDQSENEMDDENEEQEQMDQQAMDQQPPEGQQERRLRKGNNVNYNDNDNELDLDDDIQQSDDSDVSISDSLSLSNLNKCKTKRQRGVYDQFVQLPDKKPRKNKNEVDDIVRREEKEQKRKQYLKKQTEAQQKATLDKILNEAGRKLRLREEKQTKQEIRRENRKHNTLGNVPKTIYKSSGGRNIVMLHNTKLFTAQATAQPQIRMKQPCSCCRSCPGKYKLHNCRLACSLECYKKLVALK